MNLYQNPPRTWSECRRDMVERLPVKSRILAESPNFICILISPLCRKHFVDSRAIYIANLELPNPA